MKKLIAIALVGFLNTAWASEYYDLDVTMADGQHKVYNNIDGATDLTVIKAMIEQDLGQQPIQQALAINKRQEPTPTADEVQEQPKNEGFCSSTGCKVAVGILAVAAIGYGLKSMSKSSYSGNCQYSWQTAKDGSRCGARAASVRPGGY